MIVSIDTGGTKTIASIYDKDGHELSSIRFETPKDTHQYTEELLLTLNTILQDTKPTKMVVAIPGLIENNHIRWCKNLGWKDFDLAGALSKEYPGIPIVIINDANLAAYAETHSLPSTPHKSLYVTVSTGIGTGLVVNGHLSSTLYNAEGGQMVLDFNKKQMMWEDFASGRAIYQLYGKLGKDIKNPKQWNEIANRISKGLLALIPLIQPDVIIFGGSIGTFFNQYDDKLNEILNDKLPAYIVLPTLIQAARPDYAVVYGGYLYAKNEVR